MVAAEAEATATAEKATTEHIFREPSPAFSELICTWHGRDQETEHVKPYFARIGKQVVAGAANGGSGGDIISSRKINYENDNTNRRASAADADNNYVMLSPEVAKAVLFGKDNNNKDDGLLLSPSEVQKKSLIDKSDSQGGGDKQTTNKMECASLLPPAPMLAMKELGKLKKIDNGTTKTTAAIKPNNNTERASTGNLNIVGANRQLSATWTNLLQTTKQLVVAKRKFKQKKAKLHNICAEKLRDDVDGDEFAPPVHEKSTNDKNLISRAMTNGTHFVFNDLRNDVLDTLTDAFEKIEYDDGETIIKQGDKGDYFYVIKHGEVDFFVDNTKVGTAKKGHSFGELALLYTCRRAATAKAAASAAATTKSSIPSESKSSKTILFRVDQKCFRHILKDQMKKAKRRKLKLLHNIKPFKELEKSDLKVLAAAMEPKIIEKDEVVCTAGEPSSLFIVVQEGELEFVTQSAPSGDDKDYENKNDRKLGPGDYFGENQLSRSSDIPAEGTVTAITRVLAFTIDREVFDKDFGGLKRLKVKASDKRKLVSRASSNQFVDSVLFRAFSNV